MKSVALLQGLTQDAFHPRQIASGDLNWILWPIDYHKNLLELELPLFFTI